MQKPRSGGSRGFYGGEGETLGPLAIGHGWLNLCPSIAQQKVGGQAARPAHRLGRDGGGLLGEMEATRTASRKSRSYGRRRFCRGDVPPTCRASRHSVEGLCPSGAKKVRSGASPTQLAGTRGDERSADAVSPPPEHLAAARKWSVRGAHQRRCRPAGTTRRRGT